jgi:hypothetical protein
VRGLLSLGLVLALRAGLVAPARSLAGEILLVLWAASAFILAIAPTDLAVQSTTLHGRIHLLAALIAFVAGAIGELLISPRLRADPHLHGVAPLALVFAAGAIVMLLINVVTITGPFLASVNASSSASPWSGWASLQVGLHRRVAQRRPQDLRSPLARCS